MRARITTSSVSGSVHCGLDIITDPEMLGMAPRLGTCQKVRDACTNHYIHWPGHYHVTAITSMH